MSEREIKACVSGSFSKCKDKIDLAIDAVLTLVSFLLVFVYGNRLLLNIMLILIASLAILFIVTKYWKISLHTSLNTTGAILINFLFSWKLTFLYLSIPLIYWARLKLKRHSNKQLLAGIAITTAVSFLGLTIFGYM